MHPDDTIAALHREAARNRNNKEKLAEIEAEIERVSKLPRPEFARPNPNGEVLRDRTEATLAALRKELTRSSNKEEIEAEIKRIETERDKRLKGSTVERAVRRPRTEKAVKESEVSESEED